jgi:hypothetical protein
MTDPRKVVQEVSAELRGRQPLPPLCPEAPWSCDLSRRIAAAGLPPALASALQAADSFSRATSLTMADESR